MGECLLALYYHGGMREKGSAALAFIQPIESFGQKNAEKLEREEEERRIHTKDKQRSTERSGAIVCRLFFPCGFNGRDIPPIDLPTKTNQLK